MKRFMHWLITISFIWMIGLGWLGGIQSVMATPISNQPIMLAVSVNSPNGEIICPELKQKIDLNNANIIAFQDCQGFYPNLASLIVQNSPYKATEDVLKIPGLSDRQKALLNAHLKNFIVTEPVVPVSMRMPPRGVMR